MSPEQLPRALAPDDAPDDQTAPNAVVDRFQGVERATACLQRPSPADTAAVGQRARLRPVEQLGRTRGPRQPAARPATTARQECVDAVRLSRPELLRLRERCQPLRELLASPDDPGDASAGAAPETHVRAIGARSARRLEKLARTARLDRGLHGGSR